MTLLGLLALFFVNIPSLLKPVSSCASEVSRRVQTAFVHKQHHFTPRITPGGEPSARGTEPQQSPGPARHASAVQEGLSYKLGFLESDFRALRAQTMALEQGLQQLRTEGSPDFQAFQADATQAIMDLQQRVDTLSRENHRMRVYRNAFIVLVLALGVATIFS